MATTGKRVILNSGRKASVAVVMPSFRAGGTIANVLRGIGPEVTRIYVVDDGCPEASGERASRACADRRLTVLHTGRNLGVGGATKRDIGGRWSMATISS